ncbi:hypothetical protein WISP_127109 [Willisornis vidua]|uniref:Uncharacterized protein n=1 Tax=Willisornis vidua TaxID=1566151 RepID=A0ABQ9CVD0_9PASS|nr:hypothetical protein WISP_127109 [Willisornis vidua]
MFQLRLPQCRAEWDNPLPSPAGDAVPDAHQDMVALLVARALLTHVQMVINQDPQVSPDTAFHPLIPQSAKAGVREEMETYQQRRQDRNVKDPSGENVQHTSGQTSCGYFGSQVEHRRTKEGILSKFADGTKLGVADSLRGREDLQRDLTNSEDWAIINEMNFSKGKFWTLDGATLDSDQSCNGTINVANYSYWEGIWPSCVPDKIDLKVSVWNCGQKTSKYAQDRYHKYE